MEPYALKMTFVIISFAIFAGLGFPGWFACGGLTSMCNSEIAIMLKQYSILALPAFASFIIWLFLPMKFFGETEAN